MASAISVPLTRNGHSANIWGTEFDKIIIDALKAGQPHPTLKVSIGANFFYESELETALKDSEIVVFAVISSGLRSIAQKAKPFLANQIIVNVAKGFDSGKTMLDVLEEELPNLQKVTVAGPSNAKDVSQELNTKVIFASKEKNTAKLCKKIFQTENYKIETSNDITGVELCSALKNIYAIFVHSAKTDNIRSASYVAALAEMAKFVKAFGGKSKTVYGLAGAGDLYLAQWGRNGMLGQLIASGKKPSEALAELKEKNITVEGYAATKTAFDMAKARNLKLPLLEAAYKMLYEDKPFDF